MSIVTRIADKASAVGSVVSAMGCAACFPAIASLGAAVGLGFLSAYEGLLLTTLLPLFAVIALAAHGVGWFSHRQWDRSVLGMIGPLVVLAALFPFFGLWWTARLLYVGLGLMVVLAIWDLIWPANRRCAPESGEVPRTRELHC